MAEGSERRTGGLRGTTNKEKHDDQRLYKPRGYAQSLLVEAECVKGMNKLPLGLKQGAGGRQGSWVPKRSRPNVVETGSHKHKGAVEDLD
jgi:hypothetical protein